MGLISKSMRIGLMLRFQMQMTNVLWQIAIWQVMNLKFISHVHPEQILPPVQMIYQDTRYMVKWGSCLCILKLLWELSEAAECYAPVGQLVYASCIGLHGESQADAFHFAEAIGGVLIHFNVFAKPMRCSIIFREPAKTSFQKG